ncbi:MAG: hypothetical protein MUE87_05810 [Methanothrix sp.]|nr:hypothetical protein [Methanothrix sp.]
MPGGEAIDWAAVDRALDWMCARERGYELCSSRGDLEGCTKFEWLRDYGQKVKDNLMQSRWLSREEYVRKMRSFH